MQAESLINFLMRLYQMFNQSGSQEPIELALTYTEKLMSEGRFHDVDIMLNVIDTTRMKSATLLSILAITFHGKSHLSQRDNFIARSEDVMSNELGEAATRAVLQPHR